MSRLDALIRNLEEAVLSYDGYKIPETQDALDRARRNLKTYVESLEEI